MDCYNELLVFQILSAFGILSYFRGEERKSAKIYKKEDLLS